MLSEIFKSELWVRSRLIAGILVGMHLMAYSALGQSSISTGSVQGTVSDSSGAVIAGAKISITSRETGQVVHLMTTAAGIYASGPLRPGNYSVQVENPGFKRAELSLVVQVGVTSSANIKLQLGATTEVVEVRDSDVQVNTEQATIQGVLTRQQIETLPVNGRNYIDLAQLEPGIQTHDTSDTGLHLSRAAISIAGQYGSSTRIEVDGIDLSDDTGNALSDISFSSIQEFSIAQSSADASSEGTSTGGVNIVTRTGTNIPHGEALYLFRDKTIAANFPGGQDPPYQRHNFAGNLGAPIWKDRLFFFVDGERYKQDLGFPVNPPPPLNVLSAIQNEPLRESILSGRLDYNAPRGFRLFYRFNYDNIKTVGAFQPTFSIDREINNTPEHVLGIDFGRGRYTHSLRFGYVKSQDLFQSAPEFAAYDPNLSVSLNFGRAFHAGLDPNEPTVQYRSNKQVKYDGAMIFSKHILRFGISYARLLELDYQNFAGSGPVLKSVITQNTIASADNGPFPGGSHNPLNYPVVGNLSIQLGNGFGFHTEIPGFGLPAGQSPPNNRVQWYVGDIWKLTPYFTLNYSVRYVRDADVTNHDIAPIPCSAINPSFFNPLPPCSGNLLDMWGPGLGRRARIDSNNFAPQVGVAWDISKKGKTVIRAGAGLYYATEFGADDRSAFLPTGLFNFTANDDVGEGCSTGFFRFPVAGGGFTAVTQTPPTAVHPSGLDIQSQVCGQPIGSIAADVVALDKAYKGAWASAGPQANPNFIGNTLLPFNFLAPNYRTASSFQMNLGVQHEIHQGMVVSADYIRHVSLHYLLGIDPNHDGDSRYLNKTAARNAINSTNASFGCPAGMAGIDCSIAAGATMEDFAGNGVTSNGLFLGGPPSEFGLTPDEGAAFGGINPYVGPSLFQFPIGRATYNALQVSLRQQSLNPLPHVKSVNLQVSYSLSRYIAPLGAGSAAFGNDDETGSPGAQDFRHPLANAGPVGFDRTHQLSLGAVMDFPKSLRVALITHVKSPLSQLLAVEDQGRSGEIFHTDFTGDGTTGDLLPGTRTGAYGRDIKAADLTAVINKYNSRVAGTLTPAGQALVNAGLFTQGQLVALGAVADPIPVGPTSNRASLGWLKTTDLRLSAPIHIGERIVVEPSAAIYNIFNFRNYDVNPAARLTGVLGTAASVSTTQNTIFSRNSERAQQGPGIFSLGTPRQAEFGVKISF
jgi:hypothetical protein